MQVENDEKAGEINVNKLQVKYFEEIQKQNTLSKAMLRRTIKVVTTRG